MPNLDDFLHGSLVWWLVAGSVVTFLATLILIPWLVIRLPADYFSHRQRHPATPNQPGGRMGYWLLVGAKNLAGTVFVVVGITMLVLPGQGLLTVLIGLSMINFPGKYRIERYIVTRPVVLSGMNWLRRRTGKPPFRFADPTTVQT